MEELDYERSTNQGNDNNTRCLGYLVRTYDHHHLPIPKPMKKKTLFGKILKFLIEAIINQLIIQKQNANEESIQQRQSSETK